MTLRIEESLAQRLDFLHYQTRKPKTQIIEEILAKELPEVPPLYASA